MAGRAIENGFAGLMTRHLNRTTIAATIAVVAVLASGVAFAATANPEVGLGYEVAVNLMSWARQHLEGILTAAYERAPALVMVLAAMFIIPVVALLALLVHALRLHVSLRLPGRATKPDAMDVALEEPIVSPPRRAQLRIVGGTATALPTGPSMVRIGRHEDNDIRLAHASVHRHHALIHRTPDDEYVIVDLSGREGNGVLVNGERTPEARLAAGDEIVLGNVSLRFETAA